MPDDNLTEVAAHLAVLCKDYDEWWIQSKWLHKKSLRCNCFPKDFLLLLFSLHQTQPFFLQTCQSKWNRRLFPQIICLFYWKTLEIQQTL